jgi:hypothetical protein
LAKSNIVAGPGGYCPSPDSAGDDHLAWDVALFLIPDGVLEVVERTRRSHRPARDLAAMFMEVAHDDPETTLGWCDDQTEFEFGLDLILDGLDTMRTAA